MKYIILKRTQIVIGDDKAELFINYLRSLIPYISIPTTQEYSYLTAKNFKQEWVAMPWQAEDWVSLREVPVLDVETLNLGSNINMMFLGWFIGHIYESIKRGAERIALPVYPFCAFKSTYPDEVMKHNWFAIRAKIDEHLDIDDLLKLYEPVAVLEEEVREEMPSGRGFGGTYGEPVYDENAPPWLENEDQPEGLVGPENPEYNEVDYEYERNIGR